MCVCVCVCGGGAISLAPLCILDYISEETNLTILGHSYIYLTTIVMSAVIYMYLPWSLMGIVFVCVTVCDTMCVSIFLCKHVCPGLCVCVYVCVCVFVCVYKLCMSCILVLI